MISYDVANNIHQSLAPGPALRRQGRQVLQVRAGTSVNSTGAGASRWHGGGRPPRARKDIRGNSTRRRDVDLARTPMHRHHGSLIQLVLPLADEENIIESNFNNNNQHKARRLQTRDGVALNSYITYNNNS